MPESKTSGTFDRSQTCLLGCAGIGLLLCAGVISALIVWHLHVKRETAKAAMEQERKVQEDFSPVLSKMEQGIATGKQKPSAAGDPTRPTVSKPYDIDKTIRLVHGLDQAMTETESLEEYLHFMARQDYRGVAPDVLAARKEILRILMRLYAKQIEADDQDLLWAIEKRLYRVLSTVETEAATDGVAGTPSFRVEVDRRQAERVLAEIKEEHGERSKLIRDIAALQTELVAAMTDYAAVYYKYISEWDRLCVKRDHAYLAAHNKRWDTVVKAADAAMRQAPQGREAPLLKAKALLEAGRGHELEGGRVEAILNRYIDRYPGSTAPAFLLLGNYYRSRGNIGKAKLHYQQAAAYYPKQEQELSDMLNPYRMRAWLRQTREGNFILQQYKSTMLGAGYFSPDLQMAKLYFSQGKTQEGRLKVRDHFARRRNQKHWDYIVADLQFCSRMMGSEYRQIFPENHYLDLIYDTSLFSADTLGVAVRNRSQTALHNCTLVLCLNLTDMYPDDYYAYKVGKTLPLLPAGETTKIGKLKLAPEITGEKTGDDIVAARAICIANEAVIWVDTDQFKIAELLDHARRRQAGERPEPPLPSNRIESELKQATAGIEPSVAKDHFQFQLPASLAILKPSFRFYINDTKFTPDRNVLQNNRIFLTFKDVLNLDDPDVPLDEIRLRLQINTWYGRYELQWGLENGKLSLTRVKRLP